MIFRHLAYTDEKLWGEWYIWVVWQSIDRFKSKPKVSIIVTCMLMLYHGLECYIMI